MALLLSTRRAVALGDQPCHWLNLAGGDGKVTVAANAQIQDIFNTDCTLEMVFRYDTQIDSGAKLFYKYTPGYRFEIVTTQQLRILAIFDGDNLNYTTNNITFSTNTWYHAAAVFDSATKTAKVFVNGTEATYSTSNAATMAYTSDVGKALVMGGTTGSANNLTAGIAWARLSSVKRYTANFSSPGRCDVPARDGDTIELWAYNDAVGATVSATVTAADDGTASGTYSWGSL